MKKQIKKLRLSKRTISNLKLSEMADKAGGTTSCSPVCNHTERQGNTCPKHKTC